MKKLCMAIMALLAFSANAYADEYETIRSSAEDWFKSNTSCTQKSTKDGDWKEYKFVLTNAQKTKDEKIIVVGRMMMQNAHTETYAKLVFARILDRYVVQRVYVNKDLDFKDVKSEGMEHKDGEHKDTDCRRVLPVL